MNFFKTFEAFRDTFKYSAKLPYDEGADELAKIFFNLLKRNPELAKNLKKAIRENPNLISVDWWDYGLKDKDLKKLPGGQPSLSQSNHAAKVANKMYNKWIKENPAHKSAQISNANNKIGIIEQ